MLIDGTSVKNKLTNYTIRGVFHIGAHDCEELPFYVNYLNLTPQNVVWIDAL